MAKYSFEEKLKVVNKYLQGEGIDFEAIKVYVPSIELLACSKIFSTREKDLRDLKETDILNFCNLEKLLDMVEEYKGYMINPDNSDTNVHHLEEALKEKGILQH